MSALTDSIVTKSEVETTPYGEAVVFEYPVDSFVDQGWVEMLARDLWEEHTGEKVAAMTPKQDQYTDDAIVITTWVPAKHVVSSLPWAKSYSLTNPDQPDGIRVVFNFDPDVEYTDAEYDRVAADLFHAEQPKAGFDLVFSRASQYANTTVRTYTADV